MPERIMGKEHQVDNINLIVSQLAEKVNNAL